MQKLIDIIVIWLEPDGSTPSAVPVVRRPSMEDKAKDASKRRAEGRSRLFGDEILDENCNFVKRQFIQLDYDACHKIYDAIWRNMDRENNLINQRISWSILLTAGFLTAQTFVLTRVMEVLVGRRAPSPLATGMIIVAFLLCAMLSGIAAYFSQKTKLGVDAAQRQLHYLKRRYIRLKVGQDSLFQDVMKLPRPFGNNDDHVSGNIVARTFPTVISWVWLLICLIEASGACFVALHHLGLTAAGMVAILLLFSALVAVNLKT